MIKKLIEKFFTLTAFISAVCLAVHYAPTSMIFVGNRLDFIADTPLVLIAFLLSLMMLASAILLLLDMFSQKFKVVQRKAWMVFAAIGVIPILPFALFGLIWFVFFAFYCINQIFEFIVGLF